MGVNISPRRGGEADSSVTLRARWTARCLLYVLLRTVDSVTVEEAGDVGKGVKIPVRRGNSVEDHQVKRRSGTPTSGPPKLSEQQRSSKQHPSTFVQGEYFILSPLHRREASMS